VAQQEQRQDASLTALADVHDAIAVADLELTEEAEVHQEPFPSPPR
jgi:hypothetical protein